MAGSASSCFSSIRATGSAHARMVSAAERYARILKRFSPLISSRSAISEKTCAIGWLSTREPVPLDGVVEQSRSTAGKCLRNCRPFGWWAVAEETSAAAGPADLCRCCTGAHRTGDEIVDRGGRDAGREPLAVLPFLCDGRTDAIPIATRQPFAHSGGRVTNTLEAVEHVPIAVDMFLRDFPVVRSRVARLARVAQDDSAFELAKVDLERNAVDAIDIEFERSDPSVERRPVVLQPGRNGNRLRFDVHRDLQQCLRLVMPSIPFRKRAAYRHVECRRARYACACRRLGRCRQRDASGFEEMDEQRQQAQLASIEQLLPVSGFDGDTGVFRANDDSLIGARFNAGARSQADRGIERLRAGMKEIERPDVDRTARKIDASRRRSLD